MVTDEDDSMTVEEVLKVSQTLASGAFWPSRAWKSCPRPSSPTSHLFSHIWMWFPLIFQALWNDSQTEPLENYVLLAELDTLVHDVCGSEICTDKHSDSSKTSALHVTEHQSTGYETGCPPCQQSLFSFWCALVRQSSRCVIVRRKAAVETVGIWGLSLGVPKTWNDREFREGVNPMELV